MTKSRRSAAAGSELAEVSAQARRLLDLVDRGELEVDDAASQRVVDAWRLLASGAPTTPNDEIAGMPGDCLPSGGTT
jgi:hypothetical protein